MDIKQSFCLTGTIDFLKKDSVFNNLKDTELNAILKHSSIIRKEKKEFVFMQGDIANNFYIIIEGDVSIFSETANGQEIFIKIAHPGDLLGESSLLHESFYLSNAQTLSEATLLSIATKDIKNLIQSNPNLAFNILTIITHSYYQLTIKMGHNLTLLAPQRLGCFLLKLGKQSLENGKTKVVFPYDKKTIATSLQMTPETFSRAIISLKKYGIEILKNHAIIDDMSILKKFSCQNCTKLSQEQVYCTD